MDIPGTQEQSLVGVPTDGLPAPPTANANLTGADGEYLHCRPVERLVRFSHSFFAAKINCTPPKYPNSLDQ